MRVLSLVHGREARSGVFGEAIRAAGHELEERSFTLARPPLGPAESYDAAMVFGGSMNVHEVDGHPWIHEEERFLERILELGVPLLGVCLGSQLVASIAGAEVKRATRPEIGWCEVDRLAEGHDDPLLAHFPDRFLAFQWHSYQFSLPPGGMPLAASPVCLQAFRLDGTAWGIQFHAEVTHEIVATWISHYRTDPDALALGLDPTRELAQLEREIDTWNVLGRALIRGFLGVAAERRATGAQHASA
ncbi:MAG: type 1 glutamine amidotransferase [Actinomycetota bacterium]|nr:type 1 glutamine amidotransferase [Actinomycetota bacterium]